MSNIASVQSPAGASVLEEALYFRNGAYSLFGILHRPVGTPRQTAFVFCHALAEEKLWTHRAFVTFARQLARSGYPVLRFDLMGNGDSEGDFGASSVETAKADIRCAINQVRLLTGATQVNLLGLRLGATLASIVAEEAEGIGDLILWAPIVDGARYMQELLRINLTTQMGIYKEVRQDREALVAAMRSGTPVNIDGYEMTLPMFAEVSGIKLAAAPKRHTGRCLIAQVDRQPGAPAAAEMQQLAHTYPQGTLVMTQEEPFWKEIQRFYDRAPNLFAVTLEWVTAA